MTEVSTSGLETILAPFASIASSLAEHNKMIAEQTKLLTEQTELLKKMYWESNRSRVIQETIRATMTAPLMDSVQGFLAERQLSLLGTVEAIRDRRLNLARFGDGELRMMLRLEYSVRFQRNSPAMQDALKNVIDLGRDNPDKLLIGLPQTYRDFFWGGIFGEVWGQVHPMVEDIQCFANSHVSRPIMFGIHGHDAVAAWRTIWDGLDVTIATGEGSRFDLTPELFDNVKSTHFEYSLATGAFVDVDRMVEVLKADPSDIVLISLGPAGTLIAAELAMHGKWALDIGHLSNSYDVEFKNGQFPEATPLTRSV